MGINYRKVINIGRFNFYHGAVHCNVLQDIMWIHSLCTYTVGDDRPSLKDLHNHIVPGIADKWKDLGVQLLNPRDNELDIIEKNNPRDVMECCKCMLQKWLRANPDANWDDLIASLRCPCIQLNYLADQIEQKLSKKCETL